MRGSPSAYCFLPECWPSGPSRPCACVPSRLPVDIVVGQYGRGFRRTVTLHTTSAKKKTRRAYNNTRVCRFERRNGGGLDCVRIYSAHLLFQSALGRCSCRLLRSPEAAWPGSPRPAAQEGVGATGTHATMEVCTTVFLPWKALDLRSSEPRSRQTALECVN